MNGSTYVPAFAYLLNPVMCFNLESDSIIFHHGDLSLGRDCQPDGCGGQVFDIDQDAY